MATPTISINDADIDVDFHGSAVHHPGDGPAIATAGGRIGIHNAVLLGGSTNPRTAYRLHRVTERASRAAKTKWDRRLRRLRRRDRRAALAAAMTSRPALAVYLVVVVIARRR